MNSKEIADAEARGWKSENDSLVKDFVFKDFAEAMRFVNKVATIAEEQNHHPDIFISYNKVRLTLSTHTIKGLSDKDFTLAGKIDKLLFNHRETNV